MEYFLLWCFFVRCVSFRHIFFLGITVTYFRVAFNLVMFWLDWHDVWELCYNYGVYILFAFCTNYKTHTSNCIVCFAKLGLRCVKNCRLGSWLTIYQKRLYFCGSKTSPPPSLTKYSGLSLPITFYQSAPFFSLWVLHTGLI